MQLSFESVTDGWRINWERWVCLSSLVLESVSDLATSPASFLAPCHPIGSQEDIWVAGVYWRKHWIMPFASLIPRCTGHSFSNSLGNLLVSKLLKRVDVSTFVTCYGRGILSSCMKFKGRVVAEELYLCCARGLRCFSYLPVMPPAIPKSLPVFDITSHNSFDRSGYSQEFISHVLDSAWYVIIGPILWSSLTNPI